MDRTEIGLVGIGVLLILILLRLPNRELPDVELVADGGPRRRSRG